MNDDREYWNRLAITVGAAAALCAVLLLCGCSTIRDAVDEYRDWRDSQTNAPAVPPAVPPGAPDAPPATPGTPTQPDTPAADGQTVTVFKDGVVTTNRLPRMFTNRVELSPRAKVLKAAVEMAEAQGADPTDDLDVANKLMAARTLVTQLTAEIRKAEPDLGLVEMLVRDLGADTPVKPIPDKPIIVGPGKEIGR